MGSYKDLAARIKRTHPEYQNYSDAAVVRIALPHHPEYLQDISDLDELLSQHVDFSTYVPPVEFDDTGFQELEERHLDTPFWFGLLTGNIEETNTNQMARITQARATIAENLNRIQQSRMAARKITADQGFQEYNQRIQLLVQEALLHNTRASVHAANRFNVPVADLGAYVMKKLELETQFAFLTFQTDEDLRKAKELSRIDLDKYRQEHLTDLEILERANAIKEANEQRHRKADTRAKAKRPRSTPEGKANNP